MKVKVSVNGYGTIGKRVADAIDKQDDMVLLGVSKTKPDYGAYLAVAKGYNLYVPDNKLEAFERAGFSVAGTIEEMIEKSDVVIDALPGKKGIEMKPVYGKYRVKQVFQGGEKPDVAEASFSTLCNYEEALGLNSLRVVSCNTTGLLRLICTIKRNFGVRKVRATLIRRGADPREVKKGPINAILFDPPALPSHHGEDVKTVVEDLDIITSAVAVPTTLMHVHSVLLELEEAVSRENVLNALNEAPRIMLLSSDRLGIKSTAEVIEIARDLRRRNDIPELVVIEDSITINGKELVLFQAVHQESIVVPENVDAVRALFKLADTWVETVRKTDKNLGLTYKFY
ncbi:MAG: type II glyceraldehyde-3-phosphate dehydrogenase [Desulfurococcales archaeon]|nr:type II glyceraldehyde-3-phosphate dehydrogenase [Desulfurococcales archaeon]